MTPKEKGMKSLDNEARVCEDTQALCFDIFAVKDAIDIALEAQKKEMKRRNPYIRFFEYCKRNCAYKKKYEIINRWIKVTEKELNGVDEK